MQEVKLKEYQPGDKIQVVTDDLLQFDAHLSMLIRQQIEYMNEALKEGHTLQFITGLENLNTAEMVKYVSEYSHLGELDKIIGKI